MQKGQDFTERVEKIIENYLQKHRINTRRNSACNQEVSELDIIEKQMNKANLLNDIMAKIQSLIEVHNLNIRNNIDQKIESMEQEIAHLRQSIVSTQEYQPPQLYNRSENNSIIEMNDSFLNDENAITLKKKIKDIQETFNKKTQQLDNMIALVIDQQLQLKQQMVSNTPQQIDFHQIQDKLLEAIQQRIQLINQSHFDEKFQQFKKIVEEIKLKSREKQTLLMTLVEECKRECEKIDKKVNDHFNQLNAEKKKQWVLFK